jgi:hypothetical protein
MILGRHFIMKFDVYLAKMFLERYISQIDNKKKARYGSTLNVRT